MKNVFMKIWKNNCNSIFDNILYKYKNAFNNNKFLKKTFIKKIKYYNKPKTSIINIYIVKKTKNIYIFVKVKWKRKRRIRMKWIAKGNGG